MTRQGNQKTHFGKTKHHLASVRPTWELKDADASRPRGGSRDDSEAVETAGKIIAAEL